MKFLFIHQNFPGQFRHVAPALAADPDHEVLGLGETGNLRAQPVLHPAIQLLGYEPHARGSAQTHPYLREHEGHVRRGQSVARALMELKARGWQPDVLMAHAGWGEALFVRDVFPDARQLQYCEYYYHGEGGDVGFDPEFPAMLDDRLRVRIKNNTQLQSLVACDEGLAPTQWQRSRYPTELQGKIRAIHDGIDTALVQPDAGAWIEIGGMRLQAGDEVVTYVARNLEPYRGFHVFMRSLAELQALRPNARVVVVGGDEVSYGQRLPEGQSYRARYQSEMGGRVDWSRVHFVGKLPYATYLRVLQVSAAHVYLTYPFVLSWSMLEAMSAGCLLVASRTAPVQEVVEHGRNGLLVDFFDTGALARQLAEVLANPTPYRAMRAAARATVVENYDLRTRCLPQTLAWLTGA